MTQQARHRRSAWLTLGLAVALLCSVAAPAPASPSACGTASHAPRVATDHELRTSVLCLVNRARKRHGVHRLSFNVALRRSATRHSWSMVRSRSFSHYGPRGSTMLTRIARTGYLSRVASYRVAENIAAGAGPGHGSPLGIVRSWMHSPPHRRNILDSRLHDFGVGVARGDPFGSGARAATYTLDLGARG